MKKKKLIVVDLDNTLVPFDTFHSLIIKNIFNVIIIYYCLLRLLKRIDNNKFKKIIYDVICKNKSFNTLINDFVSEIVKKIDKSVLEKVNEKADEETLIVLCSASPDFYVEKIAIQLGWIGFGSHYESEVFYNLRGNMKLDFILKKFPPDYYHYYYSISDGITDLELLKKFKYWHLKK
ncbi:MAG: HAD family hydrolase [Bacteroidales bacterium]|nr:HAD family hydrolase [Bacteroidales bacterium]